MEKDITCLIFPIIREKMLQAFYSEEPEGIEEAALSITHIIHDTRSPLYYFVKTEVFTKKRS